MRLGNVYLVIQVMHFPISLLFFVSCTSTRTNSSARPTASRSYLLINSYDVLMSKEKAEALGLKPIAKIISYADAEQSPEWFTTTPSLALPKAAEKAGLKLSDIDFFELNEAFSVVGLANIRLMNLNPAKVNVNGGAVSLGHPLGASGARILVTLIHVLKQQNARYGAAAICNGGGGASAMIIENIN